MGPVVMYRGREPCHGSCCRAKCTRARSIIAAGSVVVVHTQHDESARGMCFGHVGGGDFRLRPFRSGGCVTAHSVSKPGSHISCNVQHQLATSQNAKATV